MGSSHSHTNSNISNEIINSSDINSINKNVVESATNTLIKTAQTCNSAVDLANSCNANNINASGNFIDSGSQSNKASINFSCINANNAVNSMINTMKQAIAGELAGITNTEVASVLNAKAEAALKSGALSMPGTNTTSDTNANASTKVLNSTTVAIENIYEQNLKNNFNSETVSECIGKTNLSNNKSDTNINANNVTLECFQSNTVEQVQECKQFSEAANKALSETAQQLGFKVETENSTTTNTEVKASSSAKNEQTDLLTDLGNAFSKAVDSLGGVLGIASLGAFSPFIILCCIVCCSILLSCACSLSLSAKSSSNSNYGNYGNYGNYSNYDYGNYGNYDYGNN